MDCLDLTKVTCRICITGDEKNNRLANLFTKTINESDFEATKSIDDDNMLNMRLSEALESYTCIELQQDNGLPETICRKCEFQLIETLSFIHRTKDTQQILNSCARISQETKVETEEIDLNEDSSYLIEVLHEDSEVVVPDEYDDKISESYNDKESDCDAEDAVSFLKNVKREEVTSDTSNTYQQKAVRKNHQCNYCKKKFLRKSNLVDHLRLHANVRPFECKYCNKSFVQSGNLKSHLRTHTKENSDPDPDPAVMNKIYKQLVKLPGASGASVIKNGHNDYRIQCNRCDKLIKVIGQARGKKQKINWSTQPFARHFVTHIKKEKRPFECLLCHKSYSQSSALKVHYRTHTNERNYGCDICQKSFTNASDLTKHKRIHDPDSKIACEYCDRKFAQRVNYRNHLKSNHAMIDTSVKDSKKKVVPTKKGV